MTIFLVSLMGVPPARLLRQVLRHPGRHRNADLLWLAIAIVVLSAVSAFYYLRVVAVMYFNEPERNPRPATTTLLNVGIAGMVVATLLGIFSDPIVELADRWSGALTVMLAYAGMRLA